MYFQPVFISKASQKRRHQNRDRQNAPFTLNRGSTAAPDPVAVVTELALALEVGVAAVLDAPGVDVATEVEGPAPLLVRALFLQPALHVPALVARVAVAMDAGPGVATGPDPAVSLAHAQLPIPVYGVGSRCGKKNLLKILRF